MSKVKCYLTESEMKFLKRMRQIYPQGVPEQAEWAAFKALMENREPDTAYYSLEDIDIEEFMRVNFGNSEPDENDDMDGEPNQAMMIEFN